MRFTIAMLLALTTTGVAQPALSQAEKENMAVTALKYMLTHSGNYLSDNARGFDFYIGIYGMDISMTPFNDMGDISAKLKPYSQAVADRAARQRLPDDQRGGGHAVMNVEIDDFFATASSHATVRVFGKCGLSCGGETIVTMRKSGGQWAVESLGNALEQ